MSVLPESPRASGSSHPDLLIALPPAENDSSEAEQNDSSDEDPEVPLSRGNSNFYNYRPSIYKLKTNLSLLQEEKELFHKF